MKPNQNANKVRPEEGFTTSPKNESSGESPLRSAIDGAAAMGMMVFVSIVGHVGPALLARAIPGTLLWIIKKL